MVVAAVVISGLLDITCDLIAYLLCIFVLFAAHLSPCDSVTMCQPEGIFPQQLAGFPEHVPRNSQG